MVKLLCHYYKVTHQVNIPFSLLIGLTGAFVGKSFWKAFVSTFSLSLLTGGLLLSLYVYHLQYKEHYYFYFNRGLSRSHLILACFVVDVCIVIIAKFASNSWL